MIEHDSDRQEGANSSLSDSHLPQALGEGLCSGANEGQPEVTFIIKRIRFLGKHVGILCQSFNGPCPLLSLINALILRGSVMINSHGGEIGLREVQSLIVGYVLSQQQKNTQGAFQLDALLNLIPKLQYGLDVNVQFDNGPQAFEFTEELEAFDTTAVTLRHGWLVDPQDSETYNVMKNLRNYNSCAERLLEYRALMEDAAQKVGDDVPQVDDGIKSSKKDISRLMREGNLIESFLTATATQLTYYGLSRLYSDVKEKEVSVFFRNNHFSCMFMMEGRLYLLLTDCGYARVSNAVWELLSDVAGDTVLVNSDFVVEDMNTDDYPFSTLAPYDVAARGDADFMLAYQLQREQESAGQEEVGSIIGGPGHGNQALPDEEIALALQYDLYEEATGVRRSAGRSSNSPPPNRRQTENREHRDPVHDTRRPNRGGGCAVQ